MTEMERGGNGGREGEEKERQRQRQRELMMMMKRARWVSHSVTVLHVSSKTAAVSPYIYICRDEYSHGMRRYPMMPQRHLHPANATLRRFTPELSFIALQTEL